MDTVFALATARGKAGVAIIRISGPQALVAATSLCGDLPDFQQAKIRQVTDYKGEILDQALVITFKSPNSFTGEDVVELQLHGSIAIINAVLKALSRLPGLRMAEPGEFTRRALENNRLDLAQVEGLADLLEAETEAQRKQAFKVLSGALGARADGWRKMAIRAAALLEVTIDFADEEVPEDVSPEVLGLIGKISAELRVESEGSFVAERIREGFEVAIVGAPNVGKSTLLNALAGRDAAITSEIAGTTRDVIEVRMDLHGLPVTLLDTAGLHSTSDHVEKIGIKRALERANTADLRVFLIDSRGLPEGLGPRNEDLIIHNKADLGHADGPAVSGLTGQGIDSLISSVAEILEKRAAGVETAIRARHRYAIDSAIIALDQARSEVEAGSERSELAAEELRTAVRALDSLIGRVDVEDLLDEIFSSFCLGK